MLPFAHCYLCSPAVPLPPALASQARLQAERASLRKDRPFGFYARPDKNPDGSMNLMKWTCGVRTPGSLPSPPRCRWGF